MAAYRVVEHLDVVEDIRGRCCSGWVDPSLDAFLLEGAEEALGHRVVMAVSPPAHTRLHAVGLEERLPVAARELASLIGVNEQTGPWLASPDGRQQGLQDQVTGHGRLCRPADDLSRVQVHDCRQEQPALVGADVGDVGNPDRVWGLRCKLAIQDVADHADGSAPVAGLAAVTDLGAQTLGLHQPEDSMAAAGLACLSQVERHLAVAIHAATGQPMVFGQAQ